MLTGEQFVEQVRALNVTHVVWLPDSTLGLWEPALIAARDCRLVRICREGEAWPLAAGLFLGGRRPLVVMQCTGLYESGDALRNVLFDYGLPLLGIIGHRNALNPAATDSARTFAEPILRAWGLDYRIQAETDAPHEVSQFLLSCRAAGRPGIVLVPEGRL